MHLNVSKSDIITIIIGGLVTIAIDILLRSSDNNARQEEINEEVERQLKLKEHSGRFAWGKE